MTKYNKTHVDALIVAMNELTHTLGLAVVKNKGLVKSDQQAWQKELERGYEFLKTEMAKYMTLDLGDADDEDITTDDTTDVDED